LKGLPFRHLNGKVLPARHNQFNDVLKLLEIRMKSTDSRSAASCKLLQCHQVLLQCINSPLTASNRHLYTLRHTPEILLPPLHHCDSLTIISHFPYMTRGTLRLLKVTNTFYNNCSCMGFNVLTNHQICTQTLIVASQLILSAIRPTFYSVQKQESKTSSFNEVRGNRLTRLTCSCSQVCLKVALSADR